jgi:O-antigen/teichoic acid export membrane protein
MRWRKVMGAKSRSIASRGQTALLIGLAPAGEIPTNLWRFFMSRTRHYARSLASGYVLIGVNVLFTLMQWRLAARYLTNDEFGLWAVVTFIGTNLMLLVDLGMSGSIARILIDHKDDRSATGYGTVIKTGTVVLLVQGGLVLVSGAVASWWLPQWMNLHAEVWPIFRWLVSGQCALLGLAFVGRMTGFILQAHQRFDMVNYALMGGFAASLGGLWLGLVRGLGLYSLLVATAVSFLFSQGFCLVAVWRLGLLPTAGGWGRADEKMFREMFTYANDIFLLSVAQVLVAFSQLPVITTLLGLEAGATWSAMTKTFVLAQQLVARLFDFSATSLAEMLVRGERERLQMRFREVVLLTATVGVLVCVGVGFGNGNFVQLWMAGRFSWPTVNDGLMAVFILVGTVTRCHIGLAGLTKQIGAMKYVYLIEGAAFITLTSVLAPRWGLAGVIVSGIATNVLCSGCYGVWRTKTFFGLPAAEVAAGWLKLPLRLGGGLVVLALGIGWATNEFSPVARLAAGGAGLGAVGLLACWRWGLPGNLRGEITARWRRFRSAEK